MHTIYTYLYILLYTIYPTWYNIADCFTLMLPHWQVVSLSDPHGVNTFLSPLFVLLGSIAFLMLKTAASRSYWWPAEIAPAPCLSTDPHFVGRAEGEVEEEEEKARLAQSHTCHCCHFSFLNSATLKPVA